MPPLTTLLASSASDVVLVSQLLGYECPSLGSILGDQVYDGVILLLRKRTKLDRNGWQCECVFTYSLVPKLSLAGILAFLDILSRSSLCSTLTHLNTKSTIRYLLFAHI